MQIILAAPPEYENKLPASAGHAEARLVIRRDVFVSHITKFPSQDLAASAAATQEVSDANDGVAARSAAKGAYP